MLAVPSGLEVQMALKCSRVDVKRPASRFISDMVEDFPGAPSRRATTSSGDRSSAAPASYLVSSSLRRFGEASILFLWYLADLKAPPPGALKSKFDFDFSKI